MKKVVSDLAHARAGDKGDLVNIAVYAYDQESYDILDGKLTESRVAEEFDDTVQGDVTRYDVPNIQAFNFVITQALDGGGTTSLRLDRLGKSTSYIVLGIELEIPDSST